MVEITLEDIKSFSKEYNDNPTNKIIENISIKTLKRYQQKFLNKKYISWEKYVKTYLQGVYFFEKL